MISSLSGRESLVKWLQRLKRAAGLFMSLRSFVSSLLSSECYSGLPKAHAPDPRMDVKEIKRSSSQSAT